MIGVVVVTHGQLAAELVARALVLATAEDIGQLLKDALCGLQARSGIETKQE